MNPINSNEENLLKGEQYSQILSERLSGLLKSYTSKEDRINVSIETGVGISTINKVIGRMHTLSKDNTRAIVELVGVAIKNCDLNIENSAKAKIELQEIINQK